MLEKTYPLLSPGQLLGYLLLAPAISLAMYGLIGALEPRLHVSCERVVNEQARCEAFETTHFTTSATTRFTLPETRAEMVGSGKQRHFSLRMAAGELGVGQQLKGAGALEVKRALDSFLASGAPAMKVSGGFTGKPFLFITTLLMLVMLGPILGLGGSLTVTSQDGQLRVRRQRWIGSGSEVTLPLPPLARPRLWATQGARRNRGLGTLWGEAEGEKKMLATAASFTVLKRIADEINEHHGVS